MRHVPARRGHYLLVSVAAVWALSTCKPTRPPPPPPDGGCLIKGPTLTETDSGGSVALAGDELVTLELETLYSAGYAWTVSGIDSSVLKLVGREHVFGSSPGQPDKQILRFAGVAQGASRLSLRNGRPWEGDAKPPLKTFEASVSVSGAYTGCYQPPAALMRAPRPPASTPAALPREFIYCDEESCTPVKDQGPVCGSCWAFATVGVLEQIEQKADGLTRDLSEQHLVSCNTVGYDCDGGNAAFYWYYDANDQMGAVGTVYEADFPYAGQDLPCPASRPHHERIDSWRYLSSDVGVLKQALYDNGPLFVSVCADDNFLHYTGGVFTGERICPNHAVVLTGWSDSMNAWLLRNSWGEGWGIHGYMWIAYGANGVGLDAASARYTSKAVPAVQVAAGNESSFVLKRDGTLWAAGANNYGQLGTQDTLNQPTFVRVLTGVSSVSAGLQNTLAVKGDGTLWATGRNQYGQLGTGDTDNRSSFVQVVLDGGVSSVAAGGDHTLVVMSNGTLLGAGYNGDGQLGDGTTENHATFVPVKVEVTEGEFEPLSGVRAAAAAGRHSLALKTDGTLWAAGANNFGQLGDGTTTNRLRFRQVPVGDGGVANIAAGAYHSALTTSGTVQTTGWNAYGQLGDGTTTSRSSFAQVQEPHSGIAAGSFNTFVLKDGGTLLGAGDNTHGQLGDGTAVNQLGFVPSQEWWGRKVQPMSGVTGVAAARNHTLVVKSDGTVWATGSNAYGQLGSEGTTEWWFFERVLLP